MTKAATPRPSSRNHDYGNHDVEVYGYYSKPIGLGALDKAFVILYRNGGGFGNGVVMLLKTR